MRALTRRGDSGLCAIGILRPQASVDSLMKTIWIKDEGSGSLVNDKDAVSVSCLLGSDVWKFGLKS